MDRDGTVVDLSSVPAVNRPRTSDSSVKRLPFDSSNLTPLRWVLAGNSHTAVVDTPASMKVVDRTMIWVHEAGERTNQPLKDTAAAFDAVIAAVSLGVAMAEAGVAA